MKESVDDTIDESIKHLRKWSKEENYSEEMTEKVIDSLRSMMSDLR